MTKKNRSNKKGQANWAINRYPRTSLAPTPSSSDPFNTTASNESQRPLNITDRLNKLRLDTLRSQGHISIWTEDMIPRALSYDFDRAELEVETNINNNRGDVGREGGSLAGPRPPKSWQIGYSSPFTKQTLYDTCLNFIFNDFFTTELILANVTYLPARIKSSVIRAILPRLTEPDGALMTFKDPQLTSVDLSDCSITTKGLTKFLGHIPKKPQVLDSWEDADSIIPSSSLTSDVFKNTTFVRRLYLDRCPRLNYTILNHLANHCTTITVLSLTNTLNHNSFDSVAEAFITLANNLSLLQKLNISENLWVTDTLLVKRCHWNQPIFPSLKFLVTKNLTNLKHPETTISHIQNYRFKIKVIV